MPEQEQLQNPEIKEKYNGSYGIVIKPDISTGEQSLRLANELTPNAEYKVTVPHLTLYHGNISNLPLDKVQEILRSTQEMLRDNIHDLRDIQVFGGKFVFWDVIKNKSMRQAHDIALGLSKFLDREKLARALQEGLNLTEEQRLNMEQFGHPLVGDLYRPHITLSYDSQGIVLPEDVQSCDWRMNVNNVHFAEIGKYGSVAKIIL